MEIIRNFPLFCIVLCLSGGVVCSVLKPKAARNYCFFLLTAVAVMSLAVLVYVLHTGTYYTYSMGHFPAPWGNEIRIGVLEAVMALAFSVVMLLSISGGLTHIFEDCEETKTNYYFTMVSLLTSSLLALVYTNDLFTAYVFVEINTIASCALVMIKYRGGKTIVATVRYLLMSLLGSGLILIGLSLLYDLTGNLLMSDVKREVIKLFSMGSYKVPLTVIICLLSIGLAIKSALFPFHYWLPDAHGSATSSSSAILSGLVLKGYIFLLIKICYRVFGLGIITTNKVTNVLFIFGALAMILGSLRAVTEKDLKRMLAYSSVAQIGYIFLGIGLGTNEGMAAACIQILAHAFTKPMLFCSAGGFMEVSGGSKKLSDLRGAGLRNKLAGIGFVAGALSMIGIPLFAGFVSKMYLTSAAIHGSSMKMTAALIVIAVSTVLNAIYYIPAVSILFTPDAERKQGKKYRPVPSFALAMAAFLIINIAFGVCSSGIVKMIQSGLSMFY